MTEYQHFDGETYITFNIVYATEKKFNLPLRIAENKRFNLRLIRRRKRRIF